MTQTQTQTETKAQTSALADRLSRIVPILRGDGSTVAGGDGSPAQTASVLLDEAVRSVQGALTAERVWLLLVAMSGRFPRADEVDDARRRLELEPAALATIALLDRCVQEPGHYDSVRRDIRVLAGRVLLAVDDVSGHDSRSDVQRVVRSLVPHWRDHQPVPTGWHRRGRGMRPLTATEAERVFGRPDPAGDPDPLGGPDPAGDPPPDPASDRETLLVPWRSVIVLPGAPRSDFAPELVAIAAHTGNRVAVIGYDCAPVISPHLFPAGAADDFAHYLPVVKYAQRIAAVSEAAHLGYQGFVDALATQGLAPATVVSCPLPQIHPGRPDRETWAEYATTLWRALVAPELEALGVHPLDPPAIDKENDA